jgi:hypothetical protein
MGPLFLWLLAVLVQNGHCQGCLDVVVVVHVDIKMWKIPRMILLSNYDLQVQIPSKLDLEGRGWRSNFLQNDTESETKSYPNGI